MRSPDPPWHHSVVRGLTGEPAGAPERRLPRGGAPPARTATRRSYSPEGLFRPRRGAETTVRATRSPPRPLGGLTPVSGRAARSPPAPGRRVRGSAAEGLPRPR